eukprot:gene33208-38542_t
MTLIEREVEAFDADEEMELHYFASSSSLSTSERMVRRYSTITAPVSPCELFLSERGSLDNLSVRRQTAQPTPGRHQILIEVKSTALNFRDVLNVMDMYPGDPGLPGCECAGVV